MQWPGWTPIFSNWKEYLEMAVPGVVMVMLEWICYEAVTLFASWIDLNKLEAMGILTNFGTFLFCLPLGLNITTSLLVG